MFKNLFTTSLYVERQSIPVASISGKVTKKGVVTGLTKSGTNYAKVTLALGSTDYDVKHTEYVLALKDKKLTRNGDNPDKYPLLFVDVITFNKTADLLVKNIKAGDMVRAMGTLQATEFNGNVTLSLAATDFEKDFAFKEAETPSSAPVENADPGIEAQNQMDTSDDPFDLASDDLPF